MGLGRHQLHLLAVLGCPFHMLIVPDTVSRSLERRGLVAPTYEGDADGFLAITPAGLRALADEMERGALEPLKNPEYRQDRVRLLMNSRKREKKT